MEEEKGCDDLIFGHLYVEKRYDNRISRHACFAFLE